MTRRQSSSATRLARARALDAGGGDDDARRPELGLDARDEGADRAAIGDVELGVQRRSLRGREVACRDREAVGGQPLHDRGAQPARGAGDDRHPLLRGRWTGVVHGRTATLQRVCRAWRAWRAPAVSVKRA